MSDTNHRVAVDPVREASSVVLGAEAPKQTPAAEPAEGKAEIKPTTKVKE